MTDSTPVTSPKRDSRFATSWDPSHTYYAGYSAEFVRSALAAMKLPEHGIVGDVWNGAGTTTSVASAAGVSSVGFDINVAVAVVAKSRLLGAEIKPSDLSLAAAIIEHARRASAAPGPDLLDRWFAPSAADAFRRIEFAIRELLIPDAKTPLGRGTSFERVSSLACYFFVGLFRTIRQFLLPCRSSNPTWVRVKLSPRERLKPRFETIAAQFIAFASAIKLESKKQGTKAPPLARVMVADSINLPLADASLAGVISSPPYCTRIDYAVSTLPELAALGMTEDAFAALRTATIGSCVVKGTSTDAVGDLGPTCTAFLKRVAAHRSHASSTYYFRHHTGYFDRMSRSMKELGRVIAPGGKCVLVVQDSYYKNIHNDLQQIVAELMTVNGFALESRQDFAIPNTMAAINSASRKYRSRSNATESALIFARG